MAKRQERLRLETERLRGGRMYPVDPVTADDVSRADRPGANNYDRLAEAYSAMNVTGIVNAYCERPAILKLAGDVAGRQILDAGCGSGPLIAELRDRGAAVTGIDSSPGMLDEARRRLGDQVELRLADLARPLPLMALAEVPRLCSSKFLTL